MTDCGTVGHQYGYYNKMKDKIQEIIDTKPKHYTRIISANADQTSTFFDATPVNFPAGTKFRARIARSSTGHNSGDLLAEAPSASLQAAGVTTTPAAQLSVYRLVGWNY